MKKINLNANQKGKRVRYQLKNHMIDPNDFFKDEELPSGATISHMPEKFKIDL